MKETLVRTTNRELFKNWIKEKKKSNKLIEADLMKAIRISSSTLKKLMYLEGHLPNDQIRILLAQYTGIEESLLFPLVLDEVA